MVVIVSYYVTRSVTSLPSSKKQDSIFQNLSVIKTAIYKIFMDNKHFKLITINQ